MRRTLTDSDADLIAPAFVKGEPAMADWTRTGRVPMLDGLRAVAVLFVVLAHASPSIGWPPLNRFITAIGGGHLGVTCFFVISGFLITLLLLREMDRTGRVSLIAFYARRSLRILPASLAFLIVMAVVTTVTHAHVAGRYWAAAISYTMCFVPNRRPTLYLGHLWSLCVEEHFYLIWPLLLAWLGTRRAVVAAAWYVILTPLLRLSLWTTARGVIDIDYASPTQMSSIAVGCFAAYGAYAFARSPRDQLRRASAAAAAPALLLLVGSVFLTWRVGKYAILFSDPVNSALISCFILGTLNGGCPWVLKVLEVRALKAIGVLSYSSISGKRHLPSTTDGSRAAGLLTWHLSRQHLCSPTFG